jgi:hypothetical protein
MGKRKAKYKTLTNIDPGIFKQKLLAVSHHADDDGRRVTTTINPATPLEPLPEPDLFDPDIRSCVEEEYREDGAGEEASKGYYVARVSLSFLYPPCPD